ncbi:MULTISPECIES: FKBP-type peptidyl-prolyl cis-trans isomerase [Micrococcaceae]|uniref:FKBP-type peptidyl-prolyl cis-trans isomerase n=1 Tax=Micrococcaceae TaxID=1268 RepID=UPI001177FA60|nr:MULTISPECIES: FKBP-type peptidyl-prolyl cis-trans isomerase [Micrococcaceae]
MDFVRKLLALVLGVALLALTACGSGTPTTVGAAEPLSSIKLTPGEDENSAPKVEFDTPLEVTDPGAKVLEKGDGDEVKEGQDVSYKLAGYNLKDGSEVGNTFKDAAMTLSVNDELKEQDPEIHDILVGTKIGSWVAYVHPQNAAPPEDGSSADPADPSQIDQLLILKVVGAKDKIKVDFQKEKGDAKKDAEATAKIADDGSGTVKIPAGNKPPADLKVTTLKEGDGKKIKKTDTITVDYAGAQWEDGEQFDSSYEKGTPATFGLDQVIKGWTEGLEGVKEGSTVLLTIPSKLAYDGQDGMPQGTLVFVVDVKSIDKAAK